MKRALIIEDEAPARLALRSLLLAHPEIWVAGEADSAAAARARLAEHDYELVFLDIQLHGGSGLDLVEFVRPDAGVIFVTAFDQHAVRAFEVNALDYLLKPVRPSRLAEALRRLATPSADPPPTAAPRALTPGDLVYLKTGNGTTRFVPMAAIAAVESNENYSLAHLGDGSRLLVRRTMKAWEDMLPATHFARVHRSTIINVARYRGAERESYETTLLRIDGMTEPVRASFRYLPELRTRLAGFGREL